MTRDRWYEGKTTGPDFQQLRSDVIGTRGHGEGPLTCKLRQPTTLRMTHRVRFDVTRKRKSACEVPRRLCGFGMTPAF